MVPRCVQAAILAVLIGCGLAVPAAALGDALVAQMPQAQGDGLVAQISQAQATPTPPPLTEEPDGLGEEPQATPEPTPEPTAEPSPAPTAEPAPTASPGPELPDTGAEPAFLVLVGLGLLAAGAGLRRTADDLLRA